MTPRTNPFTREQLVEHAKRVHSGHASIARVCENRYDGMGQTSAIERDMMETIVAVLESYPLANPAAECVRIVCADLEDRGGFREVIAQIGASEWTKLKQLLAEKLAATVVYAAPVTLAEEAITLDVAKPTEDVEMNFA